MRRPWCQTLLFVHKSAKSALIDALRAAESEAPAGIPEKLQKLAENCERLQAEIGEKITKKASRQN